MAGVRNGQAWMETVANSGGVSALILRKSARRVRQGRQRVSSRRRPEVAAARGVPSVPGKDAGGEGGGRRGGRDKLRV